MECPSVPRTPTSPVELVGNRSLSAGAQVHPGHAEGRSDEGEKRERDGEREADREREKEGGRGSESLSDRDRERQTRREATGNWKREREGKRHEDRRGKTEVQRARDTQRKTERDRDVERQTERGDLVPGRGGGVPSAGGSLSFRKKQLGQEVTAAHLPSPNIHLQLKLMTSVVAHS